jgi:hypothetical protein
MLFSLKRPWAYIGIKFKEIILIKGKQGNMYLATLCGALNVDLLERLEFKGKKSSLDCR